MSNRKGLFDNPNYFKIDQDNIIDDKKENNSNSLIKKKQTRQSIFDNNRTIDNSNINFNLKLDETSNLTLDESNYFDLTHNNSKIILKNNNTNLDLLSNFKN